MPGPDGLQMAYAVHTSTCTYLLDDDGVCRWIVSPRGMVPAHIRQCIGAQFVACLDMSIEGGLIGELRIGAHALFVHHTGEHMVLMRTAPVTRVDDRRAPPSRAEVELPSAVPSSRRTYRSPAKPPSFGTVRHQGEEQTITVTMRFREPPTIKGVLHRDE